MPEPALKIFSYLPNPRVWKALIAADLLNQQVEVIGDIALSMDALADCFSLDTVFPLIEFYQVRDLVRNMTTASLEDTSFPPKPQHLV